MRTHALMTKEAARPGLAPMQRAPTLRSILLGAGVQPKLRVGAVDDPAEAEADRTADRIMRMPDPRLVSSASEPPPDQRGILRRKCAQCADEARVQRKETQGASPTGGPLSPAAESAVSSLGPGAPLPASERAFFEPRFGHSLGHVRVHDGAQAAHAASSISARAFALGSSVAFARGEYQPGTRGGRELMAHELAHVSGRDSQPTVAKRKGESGDAAGPQNVAGLNAALEMIRNAAGLVPGLAPFVASIDLIKAIYDLWNHREEHLRLLLDGIGTVIESIPGIARQKLDAFVAAAGTGAEAAGCVLNQLVRFLDSMAQNWRGVLEGFVRDMFFVGLFERSVPAIIENLTGMASDVSRGEVRSAADRVVTIMTEVNGIAGVVFLWSALLTTVVGTTAGSVVPAAGNAAGAAAGLTIPQVINIGLIASVVTAETLRVGRGLDDMSRFWDDLAAREAGCQQVAEGVFSLGFTAALFYLGPGVQRVARSIIGRAAAAITTGAGAALREATTLVESIRPPALVSTPQGLTMPFAGPEPALNPRPTSRRTVPRTPPATTTAPAPRPPNLPAPTPAQAANTRGQLRSAAATASEDPLRRVDLCAVEWGLQPGANARRIVQRPAVNGNTTVSLAAFRLDGGVSPPTGQDTTPASRQWIRSIGLPVDDAGHVIANRFGGLATYNGANGNVFPQNLSFNRGTMRSYDAVVAALHQRGCDVCVRISLVYDSETSLRPSGALYTILYRSNGARSFNPPIGPAQVPNP